MSTLLIANSLRFTMQHIHSYAPKKGNECADHAAALGTFGLVSNQNISTCWAHPSFDSNSCFAGVLFHAVSLRDQSRFHLCVLGRLLFCCLAQQMQTHLCGGKQLTMEAIDTCSTSIRSSLLTTPDSDEYDEHNMWNHTLKLLRQEHVVTGMESYLDEAVLGRTALSCRFALALQCDKAELHYRPMLRLNSKASSLFFWSIRLGRME